MTYGQLLQNPTYNKKSVLETLIREYSKLKREEIWRHLDDEIDSNVLSRIEAGYQAYAVDKKPLEYILGHVDFFGKEFCVNENTIIPRPETEYMVQAVNDFIHDDNNKYILLDIGTGSGILGLSILMQNNGFFYQAIMTDISETALDVAKQNYDRFKNELGDIQLDIIKCNLADFHIPTTHPIILVANLPYIPDQTFDTNALENVQKREPRLAFVGGDDGLNYYREMFSQIIQFYTHSSHSSDIPSCHKDDLEIQITKKLTMFLEMMTWQVEILKNEFAELLAFEEVQTFHFNIRIVKCRIK